MTSWHTLWAFLLFLPLLALLVWNFMQKREKRGTLRFSHKELFAELPLGLRARLANLPMWLVFAALVLAILALARPQKSDTKIKRNVEGIDIMIVLDISDSMLIEDMRPVNRMESAKNTIRDFINGRVSDRIGLVVFSGEAYTRIPLTLDYDMLRKSVSEVEPSRNIKMGTAIGVALANAVGRMRDSKARSRVIIFLTDGENNSGTIDPETALEMAKGYKLRIYSIGVGKDGQAQLPITRKDAFGRTIKTYQPIHSKVNDELLGKFAKDTGGKYYRATNTQSLVNVFRDIDQLEKTKVDVNQFTRYDELFKPYLLWAVLIYVLQGLLAATWLRRIP